MSTSTAAGPADHRTTTTRRPLTWFVTGSSRGFGREWADAALERGDRVVATAREVERLEPLVRRHGDAVLPLRLDVTDRAAVLAAVQQGADRFGSLDVVVNNAGYGHFGMVEELTEREVRDQLETNFFGALWVTQAALPVMRAQGSGRILQVTSEGGVRAYPGIGAYHASKWALEGLSESLWQEVEGFGIHVTNVEPGPYATDWLARGARRSAESDAYRAVRERSDQTWEVGDPRHTRAAVLRLVDAERPPHRLLLGRSYDDLAALYAERLRTWQEWQPVALAAF
ncbi:SDR family NAD(P)-dependent oxidoreductase [Microlunatus flavus]|uniref:NADP-dependent 3-hydroxy acid dehydrogenase YdfG n=1 Tax=Microlunatus flavus TaxID=1036181 RepID=A0A1H9EQK4_9ACTN|nr:SDR family NAD(P)-dependent oxidoreductase [Microlunatus flavus]SEQ27971.1 NADP-dependent 3-hydroxy acid dehydrogenase YdfG [Microlunatus flavus]